jgi:hypothetical protein
MSGLVPLLLVFAVSCFGLLGRWASGDIVFHGRTGQVFQAVMLTLSVLLLES